MNKLDKFKCFTNTRSLIPYVLLRVVFESTVNKIKMHRFVREEKGSLGFLCYNISTHSHNTGRRNACSTTYDNSTDLTNFTNTCSLSVQMAVWSF